MEKYRMGAGQERLQFHLLNVSFFFGGTSVNAELACAKRLTAPWQPRKVPSICHLCSRDGRRTSRAQDWAVRMDGRDTGVIAHIWRGFNKFKYLWDKCAWHPASCLSYYISQFFFIVIPELPERAFLILKNQMVICVFSISKCLVSSMDKY